MVISVSTSASDTIFDTGISSAFADLMDPDIFAEETASAPKPKVGRPKRKQIIDDEDLIDVPEELAHLNWFIDDAHAPVTVESVAKSVFPAWLRYHEFSDNLILEDNDTRPCSTVDNPDMFFPEIPDEDDYADGKLDPQYRVLLNVARRDKLQSRAKCFECPIVNDCAVKAMLYTNKQDADNRMAFREAAKENGERYTEKQADYDMNSIHFPGIWGGYDSYERRLLLGTLNTMYSDYRDGVESLKSGIMGNNPEYKGMPVEEIGEYRRIAIAR